MQAYIKESLSLMAEYFVFRGFLSPGEPDSRVCVLAGPNVSGKSFLVTVLTSLLKSDSVEPLPVSMKYRTASGMARVFVYGDEAEQSTGATSLSALSGALSTSRSRTTPHMVILDEPDLGLSEGYASALGTYLAEYANALPENARGFLLITHSKSLVASFTQALKERPHFVHMETPRTLDEWLGEKEVKSVEDLLQLGETSLERQRATWKALNELDS